MGVIHPSPSSLERHILGWFSIDGPISFFSFRLRNWQFRLESSQVLKVRICAAERIGANVETYYAKMRRDGWFGILKLIMKL